MEKEGRAALYAARTEADQKGAADGRGHDHERALQPERAQATARSRHGVRDRHRRAALQHLQAACATWKDTWAQGEEPKGPTLTMGGTRTDRGQHHEHPHEESEAAAGEEEADAEHKERGDAAKDAEDAADGQACCGTKRR